MLVFLLSEIFERDLLLLKKEIAAYNSPGLLWKPVSGVKNPGGNLCLHLCGNLQHFIGHVLGGIPYIRNRENEFSASGIAPEVLLSEVDRTILSVKGTLAKITEGDIQKDFPSEMSGRKVSTGFFLIHLSTHLNYHLGQINYHRRIADS